MLRLKTELKFSFYIIYSRFWIKSVEHDHVSALRRNQGNSGGEREPGRGPYRGNQGWDWTIKFKGVGGQENKGFVWTMDFREGGAGKPGVGLDHGLQEGKGHGNQGWDRPWTSGGDSGGEGQGNQGGDKLTNLIKK